MTASYFVVEDESPRTGRYIAQPCTAGPWAADLQHGGPPTALLVQAAERFVVDEVGRSDLIAARVSAEFVGPVPVAEVHTVATLTRAARSAALVEVSLSAQGRVCLQARVWFVTATDTTALPPPAATLPINADAAGLGLRFAYADSIEWRPISGSFIQQGPGVVWARPRADLIPGRTISGLQRAALIGDSASGISSELDWEQWSFLNVDLDVHLARPVHGDWLLMNALTQLGTHGFGLARSTLSDIHGTVGSTAQTLVLTPRQR